VIKFSRSSNLFLAEHFHSCVRRNPGKICWCREISKGRDGTEQPRICRWIAHSREIYLRSKEYFATADDPDAPVGTWVHWVLYNLPATATELPENTPKSQHIPGGGTQGLNDFKHLGYGGPCPRPAKRIVTFSNSTPLQ
jgi:Raf kinase inhibitor-like YbhB/YbcL family protein